VCLYSVVKPCPRGVLPGCGRGPLGRPNPARIIFWSIQIIITSYALLCIMVRPQKRRIIENEPAITYYKPQGIPLRDLEENALSVDELEALRLADAEGLDQTTAADKMGVHQSTFNRILSKARRKAAEALCSGKAIRIQGGAYTMPRRDGTGPAGRQYGGRGRQGLGFQPGTCRCPSCGHETPHARGQPCNRTPCPKCGQHMARKD
jgi:predicted DNA-binding protein (UPF0251 family)